MAKHNTIIVSGKVFKPETKTFKSGSFKFRFALAIDDSKKNKDTGEWDNKTVWLDVECWNKTAERYENLAEREMVIVEGQLKCDEYEYEGQKRKKYYVLPYKITVCEQKAKPASNTVTVDQETGEIISDSTGQNITSAVPF